MFDIGVNKILLLVVTIMTLAFTAGCGGAGVSQGGVSVTVDQALTLWQNKETVIIDEGGMLARRGPVVK
jgi:hydroxyacylglutathione hydrolase